MRIIEDYINDILDAIAAIDQFTSEMSFDDFINDRKTRDAIVRNIEIIGEATKNLPEDLRKKYQEIPWNKMAGMRDKLIHEYFGIDDEILWETIKKDLPPLQPKIKEIKRSI